jgi:hypothetical protein
MHRERTRKVVLVLVGLLFSACIYPLTDSLWHANKSDYGDDMMLSLYVALGVFLLLSVRNPSANRSLIAFAAWSSFAHAAVMAVIVFQNPKERVGIAAADASGDFSRCLSIPGPATRADVRQDIQPCCSTRGAARSLSRSGGTIQLGDPGSPPGTLTPHVSLDKRRLITTVIMLAVELASFTVEFPEHLSPDRRQYCLDRCSNTGALVEQHSERVVRVVCSTRNQLTRVGYLLLCSHLSDMCRVTSTSGSAGASECLPTCLRPQVGKSQNSPSQ